MPAILSHALSRSLMRMDQDLTLNTVSLQPLPEHPLVWRLDHWLLAWRIAAGWHPDVGDLRFADSFHMRMA